MSLSASNVKGHLKNHPINFDWLNHTILKTSNWLNSFPHFYHLCSSFFFPSKKKWNSGPVANSFRLASKYNTDLPPSPDWIRKGQGHQGKRTGQGRRGGEQQWKFRTASAATPADGQQCGLARQEGLLRRGRNAQIAQEAVSVLRLKGRERILGTKKNEEATNNGVPGVESFISANGDPPAF